MKSYAPGPQGFVQWFAVNYPKEYRRAVNSQPSGMAGLGVWYNPLTWFSVPTTAAAAKKPVPKTAAKPAPAPIATRAAAAVGTTAVAAVAAPVNWFTSAWGAISQAFDTKLQYDKNKLLIQQQMTRATQGLPPANVPAASPTSAPDPAALDSLIADTMPGGYAPSNGKPPATNNTMLWVVGIGAALFLLPRLLGK